MKIFAIFAFGGFLSVFWIVELVAKPLIVTTIKPLALIAASAVGGSAQVEFLQPSGQSAHDLYLSPSMLKRLASADLVIRVDPAFEHRLNKQFEKLPRRQLLTASKLDMHWPSSETVTGLFKRDLHFWLNPANADILAGRIQKIFELPIRPLIDQATLAEYQRQLSIYRDRPTISYHDAYGHFSAAFGLLSPVSMRDSAGLARGLASRYSLQKRALNSRPACVFVERENPGRDATAMAKKLGVTTKNLDPQGIHIAINQSAYGDFFNRLVSQYLACFDTSE